MGTRVFSKDMAESLKYNTFEVVMHNKEEESYGQIIGMRNRFRR